MGVRIRRLRIPLRDLVQALAAAGVAVVVEIGLRTTTLPRLARRMGAPLALDDADWLPAQGHATGAEELPAWARARVRATQRVLRHWPFGDTCLRQALISGQRLRRLHPTLHVGVAKVDGSVRAHAWLVVAGTVVDPRYAAASYLTLASARRGLD